MWMRRNTRVAATGTGPPPRTAALEGTPEASTVPSGPLGRAPAPKHAAPPRHRAARAF